MNAKNHNQKFGRYMNSDWKAIKHLPTYIARRCLALWRNVWGYANLSCCFIVQVVESLDQLDEHVFVDYR